MMNREEKLFLQLLSDHIHGRRTAADAEGCDWERICDLAKKQYLSGIAYTQLRGVLPGNDPVMQKLHGGFMTEVFHDVCSMEEFKAVSRALTDAKIPFLPMKGIHLCRYYPAPELRCMSDIDMVIRPEDRQRCHEVMMGLGFSCTKDLHEVWTYRQDVVAFEIHDLMMYENLTNGFDLRGYFSKVWDHTVDVGAGRLEIDPSFHFLFLLAHLAKHALNAGCGFRNYLDLVLMSRGETLDYPWIEGELKKMGLWKFAGVCFALCEHWFGVEMPMQAARLDNAFLEKVTEKTMCDGAFGLDNVENKTSGTAKEMKRSKVGYWRTAAGLVLHYLFPPYRNMQLIPQYSFVDGRPWLMPVAWVYRLWYCFRHKFAFGRDKLLQPLTHREEIARKTDFMDQWGL